MLNNTHPVKRAISRHIRARNTIAAVNTSLLISLGIASGSALAQTDLQVDRRLAERPMHYGWECQPLGEGWDCHEKLLPGAVGNRPIIAGTVAAAQPQQHRLDWVSKEFLSEEQRQQLDTNCCGAYIEPTRDYEDADLTPEDAPMRATADKSEYLSETEAVLEGDVAITQGYRQLHADSISLNQSTDQASLEGSVTIREPGLLLSGERGDIDMAANNSNLDSAEFVLHQAHIRGSAEKIEKLGDNIVLLTDGGITSCEPESNTWFLKASEIELDQEAAQGTAKHVRLKVKDIPVFYFPYMTFPIGDARKSGFLYPALAISDKNGFEVAAPYYFNLAPNYDATLTPRYLSERGLVTELETRHLSKHFTTTVSGSYLSNDNGGAVNDGDQQLIDEGLITETQATPYEDQDRWLIDVDQRGGIGERWRTDIDYTEVSDKDFFRDLDTQSIEVNSQTYLLQRGMAGYSFNNWTTSIRAEQYQTVSTAAEQYRLLPAIDLDGRYRFGDIEVSLLNEFSSFDHKDKDENINRITGDRARADYKIAWDKRWIWGHFKPSIGGSALRYELDDQNLTAGVNNAPSAAAGMASLDMGLNFERDGSLFGNSYLQTFEPRVFSLYRDYDEDQAEFYNLTKNNSDIDFDTSAPTFSYGQLFRDSRFVGGDRIDDANQTSVGLTTRFISADSGAERLRLSLGQIYYHGDRRVTLNGISETQSSSEIAAQISGQLSDSWRLSSDVLFDPYTDKLIESSSRYDEGTSEISRGSVALRYLDDNYRIFNLAYRFTRKAMVVDSTDSNDDGDSTELIDGNIEQLDASLILPIAGNWNLIGRSLYDINYDRELETFAGFEYDSCCYRFRLVGRKWLDNTLHTQVPDQDLEYDQGIFFEIQFKGLGSTSKEVSNILTDGILNYDRREQALNGTNNF